MLSLDLASWAPRPWRAPERPLEQGFFGVSKLEGLTVPARTATKITARKRRPNAITRAPHAPQATPASRRGPATAPSLRHSHPRPRRSHHAPTTARSGLAPYASVTPGPKGAAVI